MPKPDYAAVNQAALSQAVFLLPNLLPGGSIRGSEYIARNPLRNDKRAGSFSVNIKTGKWADFATGDKGGDFISLIAYLDQVSQPDACRRLKDIIGDGDVVRNRITKGSGNPEPTWSAILPVPQDAPQPNFRDRDLGTPSSVYTYKNQSGDTLMHVARYDGPDGKEFRPFTFCRNEKTGKRQWRRQALCAPRPLFGLEELQDRDKRTVIVCEGEKATLSARRIVSSSQYCVVASYGGSNGAAKTDWSPLGGRRVIIWPDADEAGAAYANVVLKELHEAGAISVRVADPPSGTAPGWDAADAEAAGWTNRKVVSLISEKRKRDKTKSKKAKEDKKPFQNAGNQKETKRSQKESLFGLTRDIELWHDKERRAYTTVLINGHIENVAVRDRDFRLILTDRFLDQYHTPPPRNAFEEILDALESLAVCKNPKYNTFRRVGTHEDCVYLDLCNDDWEVVEITKNGWQVIQDPPIKFIRSPAMMPLPHPEAGTEISTLRRFINADDDQFTLLVGFLVSTLNPKGPYLMLSLSGEQGSSKSTITKMIKALIDPHKAPTRMFPQTERDMFISAENSYLLAYDNISSIPGWLSDVLSSLSTGAGYSTRTLHTDQSETVFETCRPALFNGIGDAVNRPDLASRTIQVRLNVISETNRLPENDLWDEFYRLIPEILGTLLDGVSAALRNLKHTKLENAPRMADAVRWVVASATGLGISGDDFFLAYQDNELEGAKQFVENNVVAFEVSELVKEKAWEGPAKELLDLLNIRASEETKRSRAWPKTPQAMGMALVRICPMLRRLGYTIEKPKKSGNRTWIIRTSL